MKSLKAAAVVAGSLVIAGAAAPAFAADLTPTSLNGGLESALGSVGSQPLNPMPLQSQSNALDTENKDSVLSTVDGATEALNSAGGPTGLLGGLPLQK
ncbi:hypothetical protein [Streptomyces fructofermentans]|uniref:Secreted protein n=1 Tax=Streptomyces fructofermentans TaxID=152141 RepID=A0A918NAU3_9ACTN|nr:hypothetical protein [Streptomyces fructofermentans]GGX54392.1 hypothetical protein GCM10010515_22050 [Streptomyces fructofermentans]